MDHIKMAATADALTDHPVRLLVTVKEAASMLSIGSTSLYELMWSGALRPVHIGRSVRFAVRELQDLVEARLMAG